MLKNRPPNIPSTGNGPPMSAEISVPDVFIWIPFSFSDALTTSSGLQTLVFPSAPDFIEPW